MRETSVNSMHCSTRSRCRAAVQVLTVLQGRCREVSQSSLNFFSKTCGIDPSTPQRTSHIRGAALLRRLLLAHITPTQPTPTSYSTTVRTSCQAPRFCPHSGICPIMLLLDYQNVLIESILTERFNGYNLPRCLRLYMAPG